MEADRDRSGQCRGARAAGPDFLSRRIGYRRKMSAQSGSRIRSWRKSSKLITRRRARSTLRSWPGKTTRAGRHKAALAHEKLGAWCEQQGLKDEAIAHFTTAVQYDPYLDAPWKHLGYVKHHGQWLTRDNLAAFEQEATAQRKADRQWETLLRKCKADLAGQETTARGRGVAGEGDGPSGRTGDRARSSAEGPRTIR